ncbi:uncharacterized protein ACR2FA_003300 [Aphomia sociella]
MESDEDCFVVIVGNVSEFKSAKTNFKLDFKIKEEVLDDCYETKVDVENIIKNASKYGEVEYILPDSSPFNSSQFKSNSPKIKTEYIDEPVEIKVEKYDNQESVLDEQEDNIIGEEGYITDDQNDTVSDDNYDRNTSDDDYIPGIEFVESDDDFIPDEEDPDEEDEDEKNDNIQLDSSGKLKPLKPTQWKSFVKVLRAQNPKLRNNPTMLINALVQIMKDLKRPPPPPNYYVMKLSRYECVKCGTLTDTNPAAWRHYQEKHGERYLICYACGTKFKSTTNLYKHEKRCGAPDAQFVLKARAIFLGRKGRSRPFLPDFSTYKKKGSKRRFPCKECSASFNTKNNLRSHEYLHRGERPYRCHVCTAAYTGPSALKRHLEKHSNIKYICDHCNRQFISKTTIATHMDTHLPQPRFCCDTCGKRYATKAAMKLHVHRVHLKLPPPAACQICPKRYPRMSALKIHMRRDHGMILMTRRMFFKTLPSMSDAQLKQAKLVVKSESLPKEVPQPQQPVDVEKS